MTRGARTILWAYIAFNLLITVVLVVRPETIDGAYLGGAMTPTRRFQWFSIACFHVLVAAMTVVAMQLPRAADRRKLHAINAGFYLWDAATQCLYSGAAIGMAAGDLHLNAGMSAVVGLLVAWVAWRDRDRAVGGAHTSEASAGTVRAR